MFCNDCGRYIKERESCPYCGWGKKEDYTSLYTVKSWKAEAEEEKSEKSRMIAGMLQIFTGALGLGRFYLGYKETGMLQIAASLVSCGIGGVIWGMIDGIMIISGKVQKDSRGKELSA